MCEYLLVPCTKIAHDLLMHCAHMAMEIWPTQASGIAARIRAVVSQQHNSVLENLLLLVANAHVLIFAEELVNLVILEALLGVVRENHSRCFGTAMGASFRLVKRAQAQSANMTCSVVARCYTVVVDRRRTDKAHIGVVVLVALSVLGVLGQATTKDAGTTGLWCRL